MEKAIETGKIFTKVGPMKDDLWQYLKQVAGELWGVSGVSRRARVGLWMLMGAMWWHSRPTAWPSLGGWGGRRRFWGQSGGGMLKKGVGCLRWGWLTMWVNWRCRWGCWISQES